MLTRREMTLRLAALAAGIPVLRASAVLADPGPSNGRPGEFSSNEIVANGHRHWQLPKWRAARCAHASVYRCNLKAPANFTTVRSGRFVEFGVVVTATRLERCPVDDTTDLRTL